MDIQAKPKKSIYTVRETKDTITDDGEILSTTTVKHVTKSEGAGSLLFTKMFWNDLGRLYSLKRTEIVLFMEMAALMRKDDNMIFLDGLTRESVSQKTGLSKQVIYNCTRSLVAEGLIIRIASGVYMIDPNLFAVGSDAKILSNRDLFNEKKTIRMTIEYTENGRKTTIGAE